MKTANFPIFNAVDISANQVSAAISLDQVYLYSIQLVLTGAPVGSIKLQVSNDPPTLGGGTVVPPVNWTDVTTSITAVSAATTMIFEDPNATYEWVRVVYTKTSGTGAMSGRIKTVGV